MHFATCQARRNKHNATEKTLWGKKDLALIALLKTGFCHVFVQIELEITDARLAIILAPFYLPPTKGHLER